MEMSFEEFIAAFESQLLRPLTESEWKLARWMYMKAINEYI
ncbi:hypothetical protein [Pontibacillus salicampi]